MGISHPFIQEKNTGLRSYNVLNYNLFLERQTSIHNKFRRAYSNLPMTGVKQDPVLVGKPSGLAVIMRPDDQMAELLALCASKIAECVPSVAYRTADLHTTVGVVEPSPFDHILGGEEGIAQILEESVEIVIRRHKYPDPSMHIRVMGYLANETTVIAAGHPTHAIISLMSDTISAMRERGVTVSDPWGTYITVSRFTERAPADKLIEFVEWANDCVELGVNRVSAIEVVRFQFNEKGMNFTTLKSYPLR